MSSKPRRAKSLYSNPQNVLTPDLSKQFDLLKVVPDTKVEKALYRMLLFERKKSERLLAEVKILKQNARRPYTTKQLQQLTRELFKNILK
jgi:hypothetical protein